MYKKILSFFLIGFFLIGCSSTASASTEKTELATPTISVTETATKQPLTLTPAPTATITPSPTPDLGLIGLPAEDSGTRVFDFVDQMCEAQWSNRGLDLPCPGNDAQSSAGYVMQLDPKAQSLPSNMNILLAYTPQEKYETISGKYPAVTIQKGDRFRAVLDCKEHTFCDVDFVLSFANEKGTAGLTNWAYIFTDKPIVVDYSLDALAGQNVQLILAVHSKANPVEAYAVWIEPHIYRPAQ
jgi:hypothetical protein